MKSMDIDFMADAASDACFLPVKTGEEFLTRKEMIADLRAAAKKLTIDEIGLLEDLFDRARLLKEMKGVTK